MRVFFFPQRKDKDRRRGKLFAIWSINKNANSGKPFLSCDNGGVVTAAPEDSETDWTHPGSATQNSLSSNWGTEERGDVLLFFCKMVRFALCGGAEPRCARADAGLTSCLTVSLLTRGAVQGLSINQRGQGVLEGKTLRDRCVEKKSWSSRLEHLIDKQASIWTGKYFGKTCSHEVRMKCFITYFTSHFVGILNLF